MLGMLDNEKLQSNIHMSIFLRRVWRYQGVISIHKSKKDRQHNGKRTKGQTTIGKKYT
jgi:hypothetical protein